MISSEVHNIIKNLPFHLIFYHIIPYTYSVQSKELLEDIRDFYKTKLIVLYLYLKRFKNANDSQCPDENEDKDWLINDIWGFSNNNIALVNGYCREFYEILFRNPFIKSYTESDIYISNMDKKNSNSQINIFWGLFTSRERNQFMSLYFTQNEIDFTQGKIS